MFVATQYLYMCLKLILLLQVEFCMSVQVYCSVLDCHCIVTELLIDLKFWSFCEMSQAVMITETCLTVVIIGRTYLIFQLGYFAPNAVSACSQRSVLQLILYTVHIYPHKMCTLFSAELFYLCCNCLWQVGRTHRCLPWIDWQHSGDNMCVIYVYIFIHIFVIVT